MVNTRSTRYSEEMASTDLSSIMNFLQEYREEAERRRQEDREEKERWQQEENKRRQEDREEAERRAAERHAEICESQNVLHNRLDEFTGRIDQVEERVEHVGQELRQIEKDFQDSRQQLELRIQESRQTLEKDIERKIKELGSQLKQSTMGEYTANNNPDMPSPTDNNNYRLPQNDQDNSSIITHPSRLVQSKMLKPPIYDGQASWTMYRRQFEAAARANGWSCQEMATSLVISLRGQALEILQSIPEEHQNDYNKIVEALEIRYGHKYLQQVYQSQLKNRQQKNNETLQEYEADVERLINLAYPQAPKEFIQQIGIQIFIDGLLDTEMQQTLRLGRHTTVSATLVAALEFEAAKNASRNSRPRVREVTFEENESLKGVMEKILDTLKKQTHPNETRRCYNCGKIGHLQRSCRSGVISPSMERSSNLQQEVSRSRTPYDRNSREVSPYKTFEQRRSRSPIPQPRLRSRSPAHVQGNDD